jgi:hypothetical protein
MNDYYSGERDLEQELDDFLTEYPAATADDVRNFLTNG